VKRALVVALVLAGAAPALARDYTIWTPEAWHEQPRMLLEPMFDGLRKAMDVTSIEGAAYIPDDASAQLTVVRFTFNSVTQPTRGSIEQLDAGFAKGFAAAATEHVSEDRHFDGDLLVGESVDETDGDVLRQRRLYRSGGGKVVHALNVVCRTAKTAPVDDCAHVFASLALDVPGAVAFPDVEDLDAGELAYKAGTFVGFLGVMALIFWATRRASRR